MMHMKKSALGFMTLAIVAIATGCGTKKESSGGGGGSSAAPAKRTVAAPAIDAATPPGAAGSGTANGSAAPHPSAAKTAVQEGAACPQGTTRVSDVPIAIDGAKLSFKRSRGGGCPQRPSYLALYGKASPMPVMVCFDAYADTCEMEIVDEPVTIELSDALKAAGATAAVAAK
jgi:hypothetical protein